MMPLAFSGLKVIELASLVTGPYCGKLLADFGADVIKVEPPGGDPARRLGPFQDDDPHPEKSGLFLFLNTNKKSITIDTQTPTGRALLLELVREADVLIENALPPAMELLGLDYRRLSFINPRLVMTSVTPFGQTGPYRTWKGTELTMWNFGLYGAITPPGIEDPSIEPLKGGGRQASFMTGINAAVGTLAALEERERSGRGQHVDVSEAETLLCALEGDLATFLQQRIVQARASGRGKIFTFLPAKDGYVSLLLVRMDQWERLRGVLGDPEWAQPFNDPNFRRENMDVFMALLGEWMSQYTKDELFEIAFKNRIPLAPVYTMQEVVEHRHMAARDFFVQIDHPATGAVRYPGVPFKMSHGDSAKGRAPLLGEHTEMILSGQLEKSREDIVRMRAAGVI